MTDEFRTIAREVQVELTVRRSRFIATALPVSSKQEAERAISRIRSEFGDATHHCFAYRVGQGVGEVRTSDDGEPAGTAGKPILACITRRALTNLVVIVTRYFGGTKLGVAGLRLAYGDATDRALTAGEQVVVFVTESLTASFPHAHIGTVMHALSRFGAKVTDTAYDEEVHLAIEIRQSKANELKEMLVDQTSGNIRLRRNPRSGQKKA